MSYNAQRQQNESLESPGFKPESTLEKWKRRAQETIEGDKNAEQTIALANLDVLNPTSKDKDTLTFMQSQLLNVTTKIGKKFPDMNLKSISPGDLSEACKKCGIVPCTSENISLSKLDLLCMHPGNQTTQQLNAVWGATMQQADEARNGFTDKVIKRFKEKPGETIIYTLAGAATIYLGLKLISWLAGKVKDEVKEQVKSFFSPGKILTALGLSAVGAGVYAGKDIIKKKIYETLGISEGLDAAKKGAAEIKASVDNLSAQIEKLSKITDPKERAKLEALIMEEKNKLDKMISGKGIPTGTVQEIADKAKKTIEEAKWLRVRQEGVPIQERERATRLSEFIKKLDTNIELEPQLLATIGNQKYEDVLKNGGGKLAQVAHVASLVEKGEYSKAGKELVYSHSPDHFLYFLATLMKNKGEIGEFKGKTVYEVLELIAKNKDKYLNKEQLMKLREKKADREESRKMTTELMKHPENAKNEGFMHRLAAVNIKAGVEMFLDASGAALGFIWDHKGMIATMEYSAVRGITNALAEKWSNSEDSKYKLLGQYLKIGAGFTLTCGAVVGTHVGLVKGVTSGRGVIMGGWRVAAETFKYGAKGFLFPAEVAKDIGKGVYDWKFKDVSPKEAFRRFGRRYLFMLQEIKMQPFVRTWFNTKLFMEDIFTGKRMISGAKGIKNLNDFLWAMEVNRSQLQGKFNELSKMKQTDRVKEMMKDIEKELKKVEAFQKAMAAEPTRWKPYPKDWDQARWEKAIDEGLSTKISDMKIRDILKLRGNEHLSAVLLFEDSHPLSRELFKNPQLIEQLSKNKNVLKALLKNRDLINDSVIQDALKAKDLKEAEKIIKERAKELKKMNKKEKGAKSMPEEKPAGEAPSEKVSEEPVKTAEGKYRYMGEEFTFTEEQIKAEAAKFEGNSEKAVKSLCEQQWNEPRLINEVKGKSTYRYRGGEFALSETEYKGKTAEQIKQLCEVKFAESVIISDVKIGANGVKEYKIGEEWVKLSDDPKTTEEIKSKIVEELKKSGKPFDAKVIEQSKLLKYFPVFQKTLGTAVAAYIIYNLETSPDKRKAVAETALGFGAFMAGMKTTELTFGRLTKHPVGKFVIDVTGGILATLGLQGTIKEIAEEYWPKFAGMQHISLKTISLIEKGTARSVSRMALGSLTKKGIIKAESGLLVRGLERTGLKVVSEVLNKKIESTVLKKVATFASKSLTKKLAVSLGVRGAVLAALIADDATVIGVLDDIVAVGMAVWMAKDIYDIVQLARKAYKIKGAMEKNSKMPITSIEPATETDKKTLEAALVTKGKNIENMSNDEIMSVINSIADIRLKITRSGASGFEEYHFQKGEVFSTKIKTEEGEILELSDEELNQQISTPPPKEFKMWQIDYKAPKEQLLANYRLALMFTKSECGWTKMDFDIIDENSITLKRLDGGETVALKRSGESWSVKDYKSGLNLFQAITMGNLLGKIKNLINKEGLKGGSSHPFEIDGKDIDFDKKGSPFDITIMSGSKEWLGFYDKIGLKQKDIVDMLNQWHSTS